MEHALYRVTADGGSKTEAECLHDVLSKRPPQPSFMHTARIMHQHPSRRGSSKIAAELKKEKMVTAELEDLVNTQRNQINQLASKMKENEDLHSGIYAKMEELLRFIHE
jgi:hypothetical protein